MTGAMCTVGLFRPIEYFPVLYPMFCALWGFHSSLAVGSVWVQVLFPLILSGGSFFGLVSSAHAFTLDRGASCITPEFSCLVPACKLWPPQSFDFQLYLLKAMNMPETGSDPPSCISSRKCLKKLSWDKLGAYLVHFLSLSYQWPLLPDIQFFKNYFIYTLSNFLVVSSKGVNLVSVTPFWSEVESFHLWLLFTPKIFSSYYMPGASGLEDGDRVLAKYSLIPKVLLF